MFTSNKGTLSFIIHSNYSVSDRELPNFILPIPPNNKNIGFSSHHLLEFFPFFWGKGEFKMPHHRKLNSTSKVIVVVFGDWNTMGVHIIGQIAYKKCIDNIDDLMEIQFLFPPPQKKKKIIYIRLLLSSSSDFYSANWTRTFSMFLGYVYDMNLFLTK